MFHTYYCGVQVRGKQENKKAASCSDSWNPSKYIYIFVNFVAELDCINVKEHCFAQNFAFQYLASRKQVLPPPPLQTGAKAARHAPSRSKSLGKTEAVRGTWSIYSNKTLWRAWEHIWRLATPPTVPFQELRNFGKCENPELETLFILGRQFGGVRLDDAVRGESPKPYISQLPELFSQNADQPASLSTV